MVQVKVRRVNATVRMIKFKLRMFKVTLRMFKATLRMVQLTLRMSRVTLAQLEPLFVRSKTSCPYRFDLLLRFLVCTTKMQLFKPPFWIKIPVLWFRFLYWTSFLICRKVRYFMKICIIFDFFLFVQKEIDQVAKWTFHVLFPSAQFFSSLPISLLLILDFFVFFKIAPFKS